VKVVPAPLPAGPVDIHARGGKDPLPHPLSAGVGIFPAQGRGQLHPAGTGRQVALVLVLDTGEVPDQVRRDRRRKHGRAVLVAFAATDDNLVRAEIDVLDPQATALEHAQPRPVEQASH